MKQLLRSLNDYFLSSVKREMMLMVTATIVLVVGAVVIVTYNVSIDLQMKDAKVSDASKVRFIGDNIDETVITINRLMDSLTQDSEVQALLDKPSKPLLSETRQLENLFLSKAMYSSEMFNSIYLFDTRGQLFHLKFGSRTNDQESLNYNKYRYDTIGRTTWRIDNGVVYVEKSLRQRESLRTIGYVSIEINKDYLRNRLQSEGNRFTYVYDENGGILVGSDEDRGLNTEELFARAKLEQNGVPNVVKIPPYQNMLLTTHLSEYGKWRVVSVVPVKEIARGPELIGLWIAIIGILGVLSGIAIFWYSSSRLIAPLNDLKQLMDLADIDNFQHQADIRRRDEFGRLGRSFNHMMRKINYLISEVLQKEIAQKESEYKALKAQINPHFLYNTLDTIRWLAMYGETQRIEKVAVSLAQILKASLMDSKDMVPIRTEMEYIDAYLAIQKNRFENRISVLIHMDERIMDLLIPRFVLQPIVENSFIHGLEPKVGEGKLMIQGSLGANGVTIRVIDDGVGMEEDRALELLEERKPAGIASTTGTGSGINNVHERIRALFGESYGLSIYSSPGAGTIVEVALPAKHEQPAASMTQGGTNHA
ncbi:MAG TPA: sensor histidine kinase [Paenibacillus sp.]|uniref:sensor histidine kinase n=1 Tax=Paenibacillus sp. TaxID=58172 RepID=UPI002BB23B63|nr:sensor histidine kinase [Paenibacillus sp.]HUC91312.1 sensor histidine kinase [Paenibacillus sp.]